MDAGDFEQLKKYLKDNLTIDHKVKQPRYGMSGSIEISIKLEGEVISDTSVDMYELREN